MKNKSINQDLLTRRALEKARALELSDWKYDESNSINNLATANHSGFTFIITSRDEEFYYSRYTKYHLGVYRDKDLLLETKSDNSSEVETIYQKILKTARKRANDHRNYLLEELERSLE